MGLLPGADPACPDFAGQALPRGPAIDFLPCPAAAPPIRSEETRTILMLRATGPHLIRAIVIRLLVGD